MKGYILAALLAIFLQWPAPQLSPEVQQWQQSGKYFNFKGNAVFYKDELGNKKDGPVVVVLHGFPTSSYDWKKVWSSLSEVSKRIIAPDFLGFGFSDKPPSHRYSIFEQADLVENLLTDLGLFSVNILAHDYGDTVAQELLFRHDNTEQTSIKPIEIKSVCLSNGGMFPETNHPAFVQKLGANAYVGPIITRLTFSTLFSRSLGRVFGPDTQTRTEEMADFWSIFMHKNGHMATHGLLQYIAERHSNRDRWVGALQNSTVPVITIFGDEDIINPKPFIEYYKSIIPNPNIKVLKNIGHYPQFEDPTNFAKAYRESLSQKMSQP